MTMESESAELTDRLRELHGHSWLFFRRRRFRPAVYGGLAGSSPIPAPAATAAGGGGGRGGGGDTIGDGSFTR